MDTKTRCWMCNGNQAIEVVGLGERYKTCPRCKGEGIITLQEYVTPADELAQLRKRVVTLESALAQIRHDINEALDKPVKWVNVTGVLESVESTAFKALD